MKRSLAALVCATLSLASASAIAAPPLVNPAIVTLGGPAVHLTPVDQNGTAIPLGSGTTCTVVNVPTSIATVASDATGVLLTAVGTGSVAVAQMRCTNGATTVNSAAFTLTVPWSVTAVGTTSP